MKQKIHTKIFQLINQLVFVMREIIILNKIIQSKMKKIIQLAIMKLILNVIKIKAKISLIIISILI